MRFLELFQLFSKSIYFTDYHTRSNFCLFDKNEKVLPLQQTFETEYKKHFKFPLLSNLRAKLQRKSTTLKLEGFMDKHSLHHSEFKPYSKEEILR